MSYCRICSAEGAQYRERSRMVLCDPCHDDTPAKATYGEFLHVTGIHDDSIAREFFSDYKTSRHGDVAEYWAACSAQREGRAA